MDIVNNQVGISRIAEAARICRARDEHGMMIVYVSQDTFTDLPALRQAKRIAERVNADLRSGTMVYVRPAFVG